MSRVANNPVSLPKGVELTISGSSVSVKGGKGTMEMTLTDGIGINVDGEVAQVTYDFDTNRAMAGTTRALLNNFGCGRQRWLGEKAGFEWRRLSSESIGSDRQPQRWLVTPS